MQHLIRILFSKNYSFAKSVIKTSENISCNIKRRLKQQIKSLVATSRKSDFSATCKITNCDMQDDLLRHQKNSQIVISDIPDTMVVILLFWSPLTNDSSGPSLAAHLDERKEVANDVVVE